ncbi:MAG: MBL fold metallo-hydrolase [Ruminococcaceae bacterium]|nr:MBL fold metallo-hydrolase [Oscillospiraceae bacterium]
MKNVILNTKLLPEQIAFFYIGQTGYIIKYKDTYTMIDGYLSDYVDKNCSNEMVQWIRKYPSPIKPEELNFIDYVFCTHAHFDHADPYTLSEIAKTNTKAKFFVPEPIVNTVADYGIDRSRILPLHDNEALELHSDIRVTAIKSAHEEFHKDSIGNYLELGYKFDFGKISVYHAGDGCPYPELEKKLLGCDVLILPINGRDYYRTNVLDIIGCFDSKEAITLAQNTNADFLIPSHYDLYDVNCVNPAHFVDELLRINPTQKFHLFTPGERYIYSK